MSVIVWPHKVLAPANVKANVVSFTRTGGRSISGYEPATRTDRGYWSIALEDIPLYSRQHRRVWNAIRVGLGGRAGLVAVPVWSYDSAPHATALEIGYRTDGSDYAEFSDGATFSDGSRFRQGKISVVTNAAVAVNDTSCVLSIQSAEADLAGVRFSYQHALYETGPATSISGSNWTVPVFPACRAPIPAGAALEFDMPTCLCRLADDRGMDTELGLDHIDRMSVTFVEAVDAWSDLAAGLITEF